VSLAIANGRSRGFASRDGGTTALATTGGDANTLIDTAALPPGTSMPASYMAGDFIHLPAMTAANQRRIIASYSGSAQSFDTDGPVWDATTITALGVGTPYLLTKDDPDLWTAAMAEANLRLLSRINYDTVTPTAASVVRYTLSAAPFTLTGIIRDSQVMDIEYAGVNETAGQERWQPWGRGNYTWRTYMDEDDVILDFGDPDLAPGTDVKLRVKWSSQYAVFTDESTANDCDTHWAALATLCVMAKWLADVNNPEDDWNIIGRMANAEYQTKRRLILGEDAYRRVQRSGQQRGYVGVGGRQGRR
jgi:hypothetical protein